MKRPSLLCAVVFSLACGVEAPTATPDTYAGFLKLASQLTCEASLRCCATACTPGSDAAFYHFNSRAFDYLSADLLAYDRQAAIDCLAVLKERYTACDAPVAALPTSTACVSVLTPKAAIGGRCETGVNSCPADAACTTSSCTLRRAPGQVCSSNVGSCTSDLDTCCISCSGVCSPLIRVGQTCSLGTPSTCVPSAFCQSGSTPTCVAYAESGQSCSGSIQCNPKSGIACLPTLVCGPPRDTGAPCTAAAQCLSAYCRLPNLPMSTGGTCQPDPVPPTVRLQLCS